MGIKKKFSNPLHDEKYERLLRELKKKHKLEDAVVTGELHINGIHTAIGVMDTRFMMASMGYVVGEKTPCPFVLLLWWSKNAGRNCFLNADGKNSSLCEKA